MISIFDTQTRVLKHRFDGLSMRPHQMEFSAANDALNVAFGFDAGIQRLEIDAQRLQQKAAVMFNRPLRTVLLSADGTKLAVSHTNTVEAVWDWFTGEESQPGVISAFFPTHMAESFFTIKQQGQQFLILKNGWQNRKPTTIQTYSMRQPLLPVLGYLSGMNERPTEPSYLLPISLSVNESSTEIQCVVLDMLDGIRIQSIDLSNKTRIRDILFARPKNSLQMQFSTSAIENDGKRFAIVESDRLKLIDVESQETIFEKPGNDIVSLILSRKSDWLAVSTKRGATICGQKQKDRHVCRDTYLMDPQRTGIFFFDGSSVALSVLGQATRRRGVTLPPEANKFCPYADSTADRAENRHPRVPLAVRHVTVN